MTKDKRKNISFHFSIVYNVLYDFSCVYYPMTFFKSLFLKSQNKISKHACFVAEIFTGPYQSTTFYFCQFYAGKGANRQKAKLLSEGDKQP